MNIFEAIKFSNLIVESSPIATLKNKLSSMLQGNELQEFLDAVHEYKTNQNIKDYINKVYGQSFVRTFVDEPTLFASEVRSIKNRLQKNKEEKEYTANIKNSYKIIVENDEYKIFACFLQKGARDLSQITIPLSEDNFVEDPKSCNGSHGSTKLTPKEYANFLANSKFCLIPSWCIAGSSNGPHFWNSYHLSENSLPQAFLVQSKIHRNWRFMITLDENLKVSEIRDPWQVFGYNKTSGRNIFNACFETNFSSTMRSIRKYLRLNSDKLSEQKEKLKTLKNPLEELYEIIKNGDVRKYVEMGGDPNRKLKNDFYPLDFANNPKDALYLINRGANPFLSVILSKFIYKTYSKGEYALINSAILTSFEKYFDKNSQHDIVELIRCYMCPNVLSNCKQKFLKDFLSQVPQNLHCDILSYVFSNNSTSYFDKNSSFYCGKEKSQVLDDFVNAGCKISDQNKDGLTYLQLLLNDQTMAFKHSMDMIKFIADKDYDAIGTQIPIWKIALIISNYEINDKQLDYFFKYSIATRSNIYDIFPWIVMGKMIKGVSPIVRRFLKLYKEKVGIYKVSENNLNIERYQVSAAREILKYMEKIGYVININI